MSFLTYHTIALFVSMSLLVQGLKPTKEQVITRRSASRSGTWTLDGGHVSRDLTDGTDNEDSTDEESSWHNVVESPDIRSESEFVAYCEAWFLASQKDISNAFISQGDLIDFLADTCLAFDEEDLPEFDCPYPTFTSMAVDVQLAFVKQLCNPEVGENMAECLKSFIDAGKVFGYDVDLTKSPFTEELCCGLLPFVELVGLDKNSDCPHIPRTVPPSYKPTPSPGPSFVTTISPGARPHQLSSFVPSATMASAFSAAPTPLRMKSTSVPTIISDLLPPLPMKSLGPTTNIASSHSPVTGSTSTPTKAGEPTTVAMPSEMGSPVTSIEAVNGNMNAVTTVSVAAITGIALGLGGLFIVLVVSARRQARKREEANLSDSTAEDSP